jgi:hypothetical protein
MKESAIEDIEITVEELEKEIKEIGKKERYCYTISAVSFATLIGLATWGRYRAAQSIAGMVGMAAVFTGSILTDTKRGLKQILNEKIHSVDGAAVEENGYMEGSANEPFPSFSKIPEVPSTTEGSGRKFDIIDLGEDGHRKELYVARLPRTYSNDSHTVTLPRIRTSYSGEFSEFNGDSCR